MCSDASCSRASAPAPALVLVPAADFGATEVGNSCRTSEQLSERSTPVAATGGAKTDAGGASEVFWRLLPLIGVEVLVSVSVSGSATHQTSRLL